MLKELSHVPGDIRQSFFHPGTLDAVSRSLIMSATRLFLVWSFKSWTIPPRTLCTLLYIQTSNQNKTKIK